MLDTLEAQLAKDRIRNASAVVIRGGDPEKARIGTEGAIAYALLDIANAIRDRDPDDKTKRLLYIADSLAEAVLEGADKKVVDSIAGEFLVERQEFSIDQKNGAFVANFLRVGQNQ